MAKRTLLKLLSSQETRILLHTWPTIIRVTATSLWRFITTGTTVWRFHDIFTYKVWRRQVPMACLGRRFCIQAGQKMVRYILVIDDALSESQKTPIHRTRATTTRRSKQRATATRPLEHWRNPPDMIESIKYWIKHRRTARGIAFPMLITVKCAAAIHMTGALQLRKPEEKKNQMKQYNEKKNNIPYWTQYWMNSPAAGRTINSWNKPELWIHSVVQVLFVPKALHHLRAGSETVRYRAVWCKTHTNLQ